MKRLIILLMLLLPFIGISQPFGHSAAAYRLSRMDYRNSSGEKGFTIFMYNNSGWISRAFWTKKDSSRSSENYYEHDANGNIISAYRKFSDGKTSFEYFEYNLQGNKTYEAFHRSDNVSGFAIHQYENGQLKTSILNNYKGWLSGVLTYQFQSGRLEKSYLTNNRDTIGMVDYMYDAAGNRIKVHWSFKNNWSQTFICS